MRRRSTAGRRSPLPERSTEYSVQDSHAAHQSYGKQPDARRDHGRGGIRGREGEKLSDAFEVAIAIRYYREGFESVRVWLCGLFDRYLDINEEVRRILEPTPEDKLSKSVRGALKMVIGQQGGKVTGSNLDEVTKQLVKQLRNGAGL